MAQRLTGSWQLITDNGVGVVNRWRDAWPDPPRDLTGCSLSQAHQQFHIETIDFVALSAFEAYIHAAPASRGGFVLSDSLAFGVRDFFAAPSALPLEWMVC
jgi:hypothetical protein